MRKTVCIARMLLVCWIWLLWPGMGTGWSVPTEMRYEGVLTDEDGRLVADGAYAFTSALYETEKGGLPLWQELQEVEVRDGSFSLSLGVVEPIGLETDRVYWLGIRVDDGQELPRIRLQWTPFGEARGKLVGDNTSGGTWATVGGGYGNAASQRGATVGGGRDNSANQVYATVSGGYGNEASGLFATVGGGGGNAASGQYAAVVSGGESSRATGDYSAVIGGSGNLAAGAYSLAGGYQARALHDGAFVWADWDAADFSSVKENQFLVRAGGGVGINTASTGADALTVLGDVNVKGKLKFDGRELTIGEEGISVSGRPAPGEVFVVQGDETANAELDPSEQGEGTRLLFFPKKAAFRAGSVSGEQWDDGQIGLYSTVDGGRDNVASGEGSVVPGGEGNVAAGDYSLAAGSRARAIHDGAFVWADRGETDFSSTGPGQFLIRASGGVGIGTNNPEGAALAVDGGVKVTGGLSLTSGDLVFADGTAQSTAATADLIKPGEGLNGQLDNGEMRLSVNVDNATLEIDNGILRVKGGSIGRSQLAGGAVTSMKIADGVVYSAKLADGGVASVDLADGAVNSAKLADGGVAAVDLADGAVTAIKVQNGAVSAAKLADNSVAGAHIQDGSVTSADIADGTVAVEDLSDGSVTLAKLADNAVSSAKLANGTIVDEDISVSAGIAVSKISGLGSAATKGAGTGAGEVLLLDGSGKVSSSLLTGTLPALDGSALTGVSATLSDGSVSTATLSDGSVTSGKLADNAVSSADIADGAIASGYLSDGSVTLAKLADNAVSTAKIADGTIVDADVSSISSAKITGLGTAAVLNVGTSASNVVQLDGLAKLPAVDGSQLTGLSGASTSNANTFSRGQAITGTADEVQLKVQGKSGQTARVLEVISDGGVVGVGTTQPAATFNVVGVSDQVQVLVKGGPQQADFNVLEVQDGIANSLLAVHPDGFVSINLPTNDGTLLSFQRNGAEKGSITVAGETVSYNAFTGSHYAWTDERIEPGMLVSLTGINRRFHDDPESEIVYGIAQSSEIDDPKILGTYLAVKDPDQPAGPDNPHLVMAVGNGEMWVVDSGGDIEIGDYLISSEVPGHAMKDDGRFAVGYVVGRAAETVDWDQVGKTVDGHRHRRISVFFESFTHSGSLVQTRTELERTQRELEQHREALRQNQDELRETQIQLEQTRARLQSVETRMAVLDAAMRRLEALGAAKEEALKVAGKR